MNRLLPDERLYFFTRPAYWQRWKAFAYVVIFLMLVSIRSFLSISPASVSGITLSSLAALQIIGLFSLMHEACHGHLSSNARFNDFIGRSIGIVLITSYRSYRKCHLMHHAAFRTELDPQEVIHPMSRPRWVLASILCVAGLVGAPIFLWLRVPFTAIKIGRTGEMLTDIVLGLGLYSAVFYLSDTDTLGFLVITLLMAILIGSMNDLAYHQGLSAIGGLPACSSFDCDWFGQMFLSGANRHAEHHAHPNIPGPRLPGFSKEARSVLLAKGVSYDRGFVVALLKRLVYSPFFLPGP